MCVYTSVTLGKNVERGREGKEHSCGRGEKHKPEDKGMCSTEKQREKIGMK